MSGKVMNVRIKYDGHGPDLDAVLKASLTLLGFEFWASGRDVVSGERDLAFRRGDREPVCPYCNEVMVKGKIEMEDGHYESVWLCGCVGKDEDTYVEGSDADSHLDG